MTRPKKIILLVFISPFLFYLFLVLLYFIFVAIFAPNGIKTIYNTGWFIPTRQWDAKAVTIYGKTLSVSTYRMHGYGDMPIILHIHGTDWSKPMFSECYYEANKWENHRGFFMLDITGDPIRGQSRVAPSLFWFPWMHMDFVPEMDFGNTLGVGGDRDWHLYRGEGESFVLKNSHMTITISPK